MTYTIFSDPHLGVSRKAHTTAKSSELLNQKLFEAAVNAKSKRNIIVGDLFDKTYNPEYIIMQGLGVAKGCTVLAGNHDETNRSSARSSIDVLAAAEIAEIVRVPVGMPNYSAEIFGSFSMFFVPHHSSQELFLEGLSLASEEAKTFNLRDHNTYLFVHCNRGELPGPQADSTLVIDDELEQELSKVFTRIFYGHIHQPSVHCADGKGKITSEWDVQESKVIVCGNTHPTSFSDISDKYRFFLDPVNNKLTAEKIWDKDTKFVQLQLGEPLPYLEGISFVEVVGKGTKLDTANYIQAVWDNGDKDNLVAVRPNVEYVDLDVTEVEDVNLENLSELIAEELKGTDLVDAYNGLLSEYKEKQ